MVSDCIWAAIYADIILILCHLGRKSTIADDFPQSCNQWTNRKLNAYKNANSDVVFKSFSKIHGDVKKIIDAAKEKFVEKDLLI